MEILDAGTGHGSVTLYLARAIQAANPPVPDIPSEPPFSTTEGVSNEPAESSIIAEGNLAQQWQDWRQSRRAVVHSVEISPIYSRHAERKVVGGFCRGLYSPHIDFYTANVDDWIEKQLESREQEPFLNYVFLDMPGSERYLRRAVTAMKDNAMIAVFVPSITQIGDCVREINLQGLPLRMEKTLELGDGISNGRLWDVRLAFKKAKDAMDEQSTTGVTQSEEDQTTREEVDTEGEIPSISSSQLEHFILPSTAPRPIDCARKEERVMVCRPKVGERVIGGGFVGLWRRRDSQ